MLSLLRYLYSFPPLLAKIGIVVFALSICALFIVALRVDISMLADTSYRFISVFLILIMLSNILAQLGLLYLQR